MRHCEGGCGGGGCRVDVMLKLDGTGELAGDKFRVLN